MGKKYILWDNDGVLVNTEPLFFRANQMALKEVGIEISEADYMYFMQNGLSVWSMAADRGYDPERIAEKRTRRDVYYQELLREEDIEIPGVLEVLKELKEHFSMAIVTTSKRQDFELIHKNRKILSFMDFFLTLEDYKYSKPAPDPYLKGMALFKASPEECIVIEDSARGLRSAQAAGIDCLIIRHEFTKSHDFSGATKMVDSIKDARSYLLNNRDEERILIVQHTLLI